MGSPSVGVRLADCVSVAVGVAATVSNKVALAVGTIVADVGLAGVADCVGAAVVASSVARAVGANVTDSVTTLVGVSVATEAV